MSHLKRQKAPKTWPIVRKGTKFVVRPNFNVSKGVPILMIVRDMLKLAQNRKEVKRALNAKQILLNNKPVKDEKNPALLFDVITIAPSNEHYRLTLLEKGKFQLEKIDEKETKEKIAKVINKKILKKGKTQLNLSDGRNFLSDMKCNTNDSVLIDLEKRKIEKHIPLKEKAKILVFGGKHIGEQGIIEKISKEKKVAEVRINKNEVNILIKQLIVVE